MNKHILNPKEICFLAVVDAHPKPKRRFSYTLIKNIAKFERERRDTIIRQSITNLFPH